MLQSEFVVGSRVSDIRLAVELVAAWQGSAVEAQ